VDSFTCIYDPLPQIDVIGTMMIGAKRENYHFCSVQYCVQQLCTVQCTHMNRPNRSLDWLCLTVLRFFFVYVYFTVLGLLQHGEVDLVGLTPDP